KCFGISYPNAKPIPLSRPSAPLPPAVALDRGPASPTVAHRHGQLLRRKGQMGGRPWRGGLLVARSFSAARGVRTILIAGLTGRGSHIFQNRSTTSFSEPPRLSKRPR